MGKNHNWKDSLKVPVRLPAAGEGFGPTLVSVSVRRFLEGVGVFAPRPAAANAGGGGGRGSKARAAAARAAEEEASAAASAAAASVLQAEADSWASLPGGGPREEVLAAADEAGGGARGRVARAGSLVFSLRCMTHERLAECAARTRVSGDRRWWKSPRRSPRCPVIPH